MDLESFWSWGTLTTFAGATACTGLFTQMLKNIVGKLPTQWLSYIIAQPWTVWALVPLNAALVSLASNGAVDAMRSMKRQKSP